MSDRPTPFVTSQDALRHIGTLDEDAVNLAEGALWLAKWAEPTLKLEPYQRHLDTLIADVKAYIADDGEDDDLVLEATHQVLARRYGYAGTLESEEQDVAANLARTIDHRHGGAGPLCILYVHVLRALGRHAEILDFAPRLLVGLSTRSGRTLIDPFDGGRLMSAQDLRALLKSHHGENDELTPGHLSPLSGRAVLLILQHIIKAHHLRHAAPEAALQSLKGALLIAPKTASLWRELGLLHARMDHFLEASHALEHFLQLPGGDMHRYTASQMLQDLRTRIEKDET